MNESFFELSQNDNPIAAIDEALNAIPTSIRTEMRESIRKHLSKRVSKEKIQLAECNSLKTIEIKNWVTKVQSQAKEHYQDGCDEWLIDQLLWFDVQNELNIAFTLEWEVVRLTKTLGVVKNGNH